jgi:hypothetical protein
VPHSIKTIAYRFDADGESIVITGDLTYTADLQKLAKDADIMVIDGKVSTGRNASAATPKGNTSASAHASLAEIAKMAVESNPKNMVLTHLGTQKVNESATKEAYAELGYKGKVLIAADFLTITPDGKNFMLQKQETTDNSNQQKTRTSPGQNARPVNSKQSTSQQGSPMDRLDSNGDHKISKAEAKGPLKESFDKIDVNGDGFVSAEELQTRRQGR